MEVHQSQTLTVILEWIHVAIEVLRVDPGARFSKAPETFKGP